ncbi:efflux RND transporter periplasmic adaptor subunit [Tenacibaculum sp. UWU-22]|uniref:efflux RND transporter periplasmic adaptor subunit n=1 Tax=Tenacibaculum sp. UWU-22 TaxID=3234187 RepID=UPI0034DB762E
MNISLKYKLSLFILVLMVSCKPKEETSNKLSFPSVNTIHPVRGGIEEKVQINGQVVYLNKTTITAPVSGYVAKVNTRIGDWVKKNKLLFKIQTKESRALQNANIDSSDQFGVIPVFSSVSGFIRLLNTTESNVFITEGDTMAVIVNNADLVIQASVPFEYIKLLQYNKKIKIEFPNNEVYEGIFYKKFPIVDPVSQTQEVIFKLSQKTVLPENLNVVISLVVNEKEQSLLLPKEAILTNETQDRYWVMKVTQDSLAIKVPIVKGIENKGQVEVLDSTLKESDNIVVSGGYELPDSTKVKMN